MTATKQKPTRATKLPFQRTGVRMLHAANGRALQADEMGLGKTLQALWYADEAATWPAVVVCPAVAKYNWEREAANLCGVRAYVCEGERAEPLGIVRPSKLVIINYDILPYWVKYLRRLKPALVVLDEVQRIANETQRKRAVYALCNGDPDKRDEYKIPRVIGMSGTPVMNRPIELFNAIHLIWPAEFPSRVEYGFRYCKPTKQYGKVKYNGATNLDELHTRLKACGMIRRKKVDVLKDLPPQTRELVVLPLHDPKGEYKRASTDFIGWLKTKSKARAARAARAEIYVQLGYMLRLAARLKFKYALEWIDNYLEETGEKIVLFGLHKKCLEALHRRYGAGAVVVDGGVTGRDRDAAIWAFQHDKRKRVFIGQLIAASEAITLTASAAVGTLEFWWNPAQHNQAEKRIDRIGQTRPTTAYYFVGHGTYEEDMCELLQIKQGHQDQILDGGAVGGSLNLYDLLIERLVKRGRHG